MAKRQTYLRSHTGKVKVFANFLAGPARHIFGFGGLQGRNSYNYETQWKIQGIIPYA